MAAVLKKRKENQSMKHPETTDEIRARLTREAEDRLAVKLQKATSVGASDNALREHKFAIKRIDSLTNAQLQARVANQGCP